jgi:poly(hydroxyalkanoate) depolymerase family esterase
MKEPVAHDNAPTDKLLQRPEQRKNMMKNPFDTRTPSFDADAINATIQRAFSAAGLETTSGPMHDVTQTIRRALGGGHGTASAQRFESESAINVAAREIPASDPAPAAHGSEEAWADAPRNAQDALQPGRFETHSFSNQAGTRVYKLYIPAGPANAPRPMLVMLHGCTQSADDFAAGTQMNQLADTHGFLVVYPEQAAHANASTCWNWFKPQDQQRGAGEPALIAGIALEVMRAQGANPRRIFVAGLSAGAAMAVVLGQTYPEVFAAVGAHSGLPYGSAHDMASAMGAMKGGRSGMPGLQGIGATPATKAAQAVPVIVFHGDRDHVVQASNSAHIVQQARAAFAAQRGSAELTASTLAVATRGGRRYSRTLHADAQGQVWIESWSIHGAGHAWSGGDARGSYTDAAGPDASKEMLRFFMALPHATPSQ